MKEKKKFWGLRPVAWGCTIAATYLMDLVTNLLVKLLTAVYGWLSLQSTLVIIIVVALAGSTVLGLLYWVAVAVPMCIVQLCDMIYPSKHAVRYYIVGSFELASLAFYLFAALMGAVQGGGMFWFYARLLYLAILTVLMMVFGHAAAEARDAEGKGGPGQ